jgi:NAD-dependent dihydropyrimidine dehydrogenase PreA subunit
MPAQVDLEKCTGCGDCVEQCPTSILKVIDEKCIVNPDECIDCNACVDACIHQAMSMSD